MSHPLSLSIMIYRAKCTHVIRTLESMINFKNYNLVKDCQDTYIEVANEELAEQIELLEETTMKIGLQILRLKDMLG